MIGSALVWSPSGDEWAYAYRLANQLVHSDKTVLWTQEHLAAGSTNFGAGALVLPLAAPLQEQAVRRDFAEGLHRELSTRGIEAALGEVSDLTAYALKPVRVAIYGEAGSPYPHLAHLTTLGFRVEPVTAVQIRSGILDEYDVLVVPGGGWKAMPGQLAPLGRKGAKAIASFVARGGGYLSSCAGSYLACTMPEEQIAKIGDAQVNMRLAAVRPINDCESGGFGLRSPGIGVMRHRNAAREHPVMYGVPEEFLCTHYNGPFFEVALENLSEYPPPQVLARVTGATEDFTPGEAFPDAENNGQQSLVERAVRSGAASVVAANYGRGAVVLAGSHPEFGLDAFGMAELAGAARILGNAVWWLSLQEQTGPYFIPASRDSAAVDIRLERLSAQVEQLGSLGSLAVQAHAARPQFGHAKGDVWTISLAQLDTRLREMAVEWRTLVQAADAVAQELCHLSSEGTAPVARLDGWREEWLACWVGIGARRAVRWEQDMGYEGFLGLLDMAHGQMAEAILLLETPAEGEAAPSRPYDLVARSYLSTLGVIVAAQGTLRREHSRLDQLLERMAWAQGKSFSPEILSATVAAG